MFIKATDVTRSERPNMRGGDGTIYLDAFNAELPKNCRLASVITVEPGCSIGLHQHSGETELFYMLEGTLQAFDQNGPEGTLEAGDALFTGEGNSHSVKNISDKTARMLAVIITE